LLISDALFYELLTTKEPDRSRCFAKLPAVENPVDLVSHAGTLMRLEVETHKPAGKPSAHREKLRFKFNPRLVTQQYELPEEAQEVVDEHTRELRSDVHAFMSVAETSGTFFSGLLEGSQNDRIQARLGAETAIASPGALRDFYASLTPPPGEKPLPPQNLVGDDWAVYRYLQVKMLFALDLYVRYQGSMPQDMSEATFERMEHDVLDAQLLILGCLEGSFATREKKLKRWFRLLRPDGLLYE
jgi:hypothetical protein